MYVCIYTHIYIYIHTYIAPALDRRSGPGAPRPWTRRLSP